MYKIVSLKWVACLVFLWSDLLCAQQFKALLLTETKDYNHESIPAGINAIRKLAEQNYFTVHLQQESEAITYDLLTQYDVVIFLSTSGAIFTADEKKAFEDFIRSGKGYVGIHAASCTEYNWEWYTKLVGRMFYLHPEQQTALLKIEEHNFPGLEHFPEKMRWTDEWYEFRKDNIDNLHMLISVDEQTYTPETIWKNSDKMRMEK